MTSVTCPVCEEGTIKVRFFSNYIYEYACYEGDCEIAEQSCDCQLTDDQEMDVLDAAADFPDDSQIPEAE